MKAAYLDSPGAPDVIRYGDLPDPKPQAGEALVRVKAAALNPIDTYIRAGIIAMPLPKPFITGTDLAGVVESVGPNVTRLKPGDRVWGSNQGLLGRQGTCAELACVNEDWLYPTPAGVTDQVAAAVALVGITAHLGLFRCANLQAGETVFVNGGTGGVGSMVVQMAKAVGAKVITTVGSAEKATLCKSWGVDLVLNYKTDNVDAKIRDFVKDQGVNVWYETQREPDFMRTVPLLAKRGRMIVMAGRQAQPIFPAGPFYVKDCSLFGFAMFNATPAEQRRCADDINRWFAQKKLHVPIGRTFSLSETAAAHKFLEENTVGKAGTLMGKVVVVP
ncbi:MAG TPA: NADPH:quinone reductase [Gemmataceae bacterium]|nr:NADPH:quinone reductase [Gemmataceae bacterium]